MLLQVLESNNTMVKCGELSGRSVLSESNLISKIMCWLGASRDTADNGCIYRMDNSAERRLNVSVVCDKPPPLDGFKRHQHTFRIIHVIQSLPTI